MGLDVVRGLRGEANFAVCQANFPPARDSIRPFGQAVLEACPARQQTILFGIPMGPAQENGVRISQTGAVPLAVEFASKSLLQEAVVEGNPFTLRPFLPEARHHALSILILIRDVPFTPRTTKRVPLERVERLMFGDVEEGLAGTIQIRKRHWTVQGGQGGISVDLARCAVGAVRDMGMDIVSKAERRCQEGMERRDRQEEARRDEFHRGCCLREVNE